MPSWKSLALHNSHRPSVLVDVNDKQIYPPLGNGRQPVPLDLLDSDSVNGGNGVCQRRFYEFKTFEMPDKDSAISYHLELERSGQNAEPEYKFIKTKVWHASGAIPHVVAAGARLGISQIDVHAKRIWSEPKDMRELVTLMNQACDRWHSTTKIAGVATMTPMEQTQVGQIFAVGEKLRSRFYAMAAAADSMLAEGYTAYAMPFPDRDFEIVCHLEKQDDTASAEITAITTELQQTRDELARAHQEIASLKESTRRPEPKPADPVKTPIHNQPGRPKVTS